jgi:ferritin-like metal-binding protein YciE
VVKTAKSQSFRTLRESVARLFVQYPSRDYFNVNRNHLVRREFAEAGSFRLRHPATHPLEETMTVKTLEDLFYETLKDIYYAEKKLVKTLPKMAKMASAPELKKAIDGHLSETEFHVQRLEQVFTAIDKRAVAKKCEALEGLLKEAEEVMSEIEDKETLDAAIISSAQTVEHYEIARYGTLATWARELGNRDVAGVLEATLEEEKNADEKLSDLAEDAVNQRAAA